MFRYQTNSNTQSFTLLTEERELLNGLGVTVHLEPGGAEELSYKDVETEMGSDSFGNFTESVLRFQDSSEAVTVRLKLRCYEAFVQADVQGAITNPNDFGLQRTFAAEDSITVRIKQLPGIRGLLANYQHKEWWTRPFFAQDIAKLPKRTVSLLWETETAYCHLLPVCGPMLRTDLSGSEDGLHIRLSPFRSGLTRFDTLAFILGADENPYELAELNVERALRRLDYPTLPRRKKPLPELLQYLGWCSWDAFYHKVDEAGLLAKADELNKYGLPVRWAMIDDGWSDIADGKLRAFQADSVKFPQGLGSTIKAMKEHHGFTWVGVWHTIAGYWGGIHPESELASRFSAYLYKNARGSLIPYPDAGLGFGFWNAWHSFLEKQGVDFVKVDSQSAVVHFLRNERTVGEAAAAAHQALEASVSLHFDGAVINCMGMASENVWHRPKSAVSRSSDDFVPQERNGFKEHALQNGYNSFYHGPFYWGDWDMFWTKNHDDVQNAVLRSVSGGPVYISDAVGSTDPDKLWPLIYEDGKVIRCARTPNPTRDCLTKDPTSEPVPLKLWNVTDGGAGVVAAFHISGEHEKLEGTVGPADIPGLAADRYVMYEYFSGKSRMAGLEDRSAFRLSDGECALYTFVPFVDGFAAIGLLDKFISADAVLEVKRQGASVIVRLKEGGRLGFVSETKPAGAIVNGIPADCRELGDQMYAVAGRIGEHQGETVVEILYP